MVELFLTACLLAHPAKCETFPPPFQQPMGLFQCMREGQVWAVRWSAEHPEWKVRGWKCAAPRA